MQRGTPTSAATGRGSTRAITSNAVNIGSKNSDKESHGTAMTNAAATLPLITSSMTPAKTQISTEG